jgi:hypothetical protein
MDGSMSEDGLEFEPSPREQVCVGAGGGSIAAPCPRMRAWLDASTVGQGKQIRRDLVNRLGVAL